MTDQKLSQLTAATSLASTDQHYAVVGGLSRSLTTKVLGQEITGVIDAKRDFDVTFDAVTDDSVNLQAAIDAAETIAAANNFPAAVALAPGRAKCNVILKDLVWLISPWGRWTSMLSAAAAGPVVDTPASLISQCGIDGVKINGSGAGFGGLGVRFRNVNRGVVRGCFFDQIDNQAILWEDGAVSIFEDNFAQNCLLDAANLVAKAGVIEFGSLTSDGWIGRGEYNGDQGGTANRSSANLYACAGLLDGSVHFVEGAIFAQADIGLRDESTRSRFSNVRADLNQGNGFEIIGTSHFANSYALSNSQHADDTYDGWVVSAGNGTYVGCIADGTQVANHRYGFNDTQSNNVNKNRYSNCASFNHVTASWNINVTDGAAVEFPEGSFKSLTDADTTPSVDQYKNFDVTNTGATTITDFDGGVPGQSIRILSTNANTTLNYAGANLSGNGGSDRLLAANSITTLMLHGGVWYETGYSV